MPRSGLAVGAIGAIWDRGNPKYIVTIEKRLPVESGGFIIVRSHNNGRHYIACRCRSADVGLRPLGPILAKLYPLYTAAVD